MRHWHHALLWSALLCQLAGCGEARLITSIRDGNVQLSEQLLAKGADVNAQGTGGETPLHVAIKAVNKDIYTKLLTKGADPNICDVRGTSVVHLAAGRKDIFWLHDALQHGGNPNQPNTGNHSSPNSTPIFYAIDKGITANVVELIAAGADVNHRNHYGSRPLYTAMECGLYDAVITLIQAGADPRLGNDRGGTILTSNGWFSDGYNNVIHADKKRSYDALKALLIEKGYLPEKKQK